MLLESENTKYAKERGVLFKFFQNKANVSNKILRIKLIGFTFASPLSAVAATNKTILDFLFGW